LGSPVGEEGDRRSVRLRIETSYEFYLSTVPELTTIFEKLRKFQVRLDPEKCVFEVPRRMLLGFVVS
jgi:hypothetical protein